MLPAATPAVLRIYDASGRLARTLDDGARPRAAGEHLATWDGRDDLGRPLPAGVYLCRLQAGGRSASGKLILLK